MPNSRRSSTDTRRSSTDTARSFSMSFGKIDLPLRYVVDIKQNHQSGHESGSTLGSSTISSRWLPKRTRGDSKGCLVNSTNTIDDDIPMSNQEWTACERAQYVAKDSRLQELFLAELEQSGVVTAAGYKAVHQKFIYGDVVEQEIKDVNVARRRRSTDCAVDGGGGSVGRPKLQRRRSSRLGDLVRSIQSNQGSSTRSFHQQGGGGGMGSSSLSLKIKKRGSTASEGFIPMNDESNHTNNDGSSSSNIAPRRTSKARSLTGEEKELLLKDAQANQEVLDSLVGSLQDSLVKSHTSSSSSAVPPELKNSQQSSHSYNRQESGGSLLLHDVFDGNDGSAYFEPPLPKTSLIGKDSKPRRCTDDDGTAPTYYSRMETLSVEIDFDPTHLTSFDHNSSSAVVKNKEHRRASICSIHSTDSCGFLPWPATKEDDDNDDGLLVSFNPSFRNHRRSSIDSVQSLQKTEFARAA